MWRFPPLAPSHGWIPETGFLSRFNDNRTESTVCRENGHGQGNEDQQDHFATTIGVSERFEYGGGGQQRSQSS